ncbi:MAG: hypothetical protein AAFZ07_11465 [Actinomycetota bacterium]
MTAAIEVRGVRATTHTLYVASWARELLREHDRVLIVDRDRPPTGSAHGPVTWRLPRGASIAVVDEPPSSVDRVDAVHVGSPALRHWRRRAAERRHGTSIVVDEGLGSYGSVRSRLGALRREGAGRASATAKAIARSAALARSTRWPTYRAEGGTWRVNPMVAATFREAADEAVPNDDVVLLSQPWTALGLADEATARRALDEIRRSVSGAGLRLVVRPHPWDHPDRFAELPTLPGGLPAELHPEIRGARMVLGETTTALINLAAIFGVPAARVELPIDAAPLARDQQALLTTFVGPAVPTSELTEVIRRGGQERRGS